MNDAKSSMAAEVGAGMGEGRLAATVAVYLAGFAQGLTLVSFPASSTVLRQMHGFTDAQYGAIFLPQVALAVIGAVGAGMLAKRLGLRILLWLALAANALSQALLAGSAGVAPQWAYAAILLGTAALGLGFGLSGAPLNSYPPLLFPGRRNTAVVAMHTAIGLGLTCGPLVVAPLAMNGLWLGFPLALTCLGFVLALVIFRLWLPEDDVHSRAASSTNEKDSPARAPVFWLFVGVAVLYAFAEGTFSNWAVIYLQEARRLPESSSALALSVFWGALVGGRLLVSLLLLRLRAEILWCGLPPLMILAFLLLPLAGSSVSGIALFALAGLACSGFFPLTIAIVSHRFEGDVAWVSSMLTAALMIGIGVGSFVIGALRDGLAFERLYQVSALYPLFALVLIFLILSVGSMQGRRESK